MKPRRDFVEGTDVHRVLRVQPLEHLRCLVWRPWWGEAPKADELPGELKDIVGRYRVDLAHVLGLNMLTLLVCLKMGVHSVQISEEAELELIPWKDTEKW